MSKIAFYAPIKPPTHPIASGDRLIAQNLVLALELSGFSVTVASDFIAYSKRADAEILHSRREQALSEADRIIENFTSSPPDLWFTYHPYCKAPDWLGPRISEHFKIPYINVEACRTSQDENLWSAWRQEAQAGMSKATKHFCFKPNDADYLQSFLSNPSLHTFVPFINTELPDSLPNVNLPKDRLGPTLLTVAQMRPGKKVKNYEILSQALHPLQSLDWNLLIIGDGPEKQNIETMFSGIDPSRLHWLGACESSEVLSIMSQSDIFIWPGWNEPIGMVYLEAQMMGLPIIALNSGGVPLVVEHNESGLLVPDSSQLPDTITSLLTNEDLRKKLGSTGTERVRQYHSHHSASRILQEELNKIV